MKAAQSASRCARRSAPATPGGALVPPSPLHLLPRSRIPAADSAVGGARVQQRGLVGQAEVHLTQHALVAHQVAHKLEAALPVRTGRRAQVEVSWQQAAAAAAAGRGGGGGRVAAPARGLTQS